MTARPPPWPVSLGEFKKVKFGGLSSAKGQLLPGQSQVSVKKKVDKIIYQYIYKGFINQRLSMKR